MSESQHPFTYHLMIWHTENARDLPWKKTKDPYKIWLSEVILQQTRVEQGTPYYLRFLERFPNVRSLAEASEDEILKLWEGLGYYSRARNLHHSAKIIVNQLEEKFPDNYKGLLSLKGIGEYTASAIASFAYNLPHAVVDGNVIRVLSRYLGIKDAVDTTTALKTIKTHAQELLDKNNPGEYNQAIMDFGSIICTPANPDCHQCPLADSCIAYATNSVDEIPYKSKKINKRVRYLNYHVFANEKYVLINKRNNSDIWKGLYEFYLTETNDGQNSFSESSFPQFEDIVLERELDKTLGPIQHILTHQKILATFYFYKATFIPDAENRVIGPFYLVEKKKLSTFAFPRLIQKHVIDKKVYE